jgi:hypothetical protein
VSGGCDFANWNQSISSPKHLGHSQIHAVEQGYFVGLVVAPDVEAERVTGRLACWTTDQSSVPSSVANTPRTAAAPLVVLRRTAPLVAERVSPDRRCATPAVKVPPNPVVVDRAPLEAVGEAAAVGVVVAGMEALNYIPRERAFPVLNSSMVMSNRGESMRSVVMRFGVVGLIVLVVGIYVALVEAYEDSIEGVAANTLTDSPDMVDHPVATFTVEEMQSNYHAVVANLAVSPGSALLDPLTRRLKEDIVLRVRSAAVLTRREYSKGTLPGVFPVPLTVAGQIANWPFDYYNSGPIEVQLFHGTDSQNPPELAPVTVIDHLPGFKVAASKANGQEVYRLNVRRSLSTALFAVLIVGVLITLAVLAMFVSVQTARNRRKFQPPFATWYAALLFAVVPLRNALPGSPPFGAWIDVTVVVWVIVALVLALLLYIVCWWRHLGAEADKPTNPAVPPASS